MFFFHYYICLCQAHELYLTAHNHQVKYHNFPFHCWLFHLSWPSCFCLNICCQLLSSFYDIFLHPPTILWATVPVHHDSVLNFAVVLVGHFIAGGCGAYQSCRKDNMIWMWGQKRNSLFIWSYMYLCSVHLSISGAAKDHWTTGLWGCGVSEKGPNPQWPPPRPAALPCGRCLGESPHPFLLCPLGLALTQVIFLIRMQSQSRKLCCFLSSLLSPNGIL